MKLLLYHSKLKLSDHVNEEGVGLFHRCGPFFEEKKGSDDTFKPPVKRENDATYKLMLDKAKTSQEVGVVWWVEISIALVVAFIGGRCGLVGGAYHSFGGSVQWR